MPEPADKTADEAKEALPKEMKRRRNWLSFSLRSLMLLLTLCCVGVGGKLKYDWYRKKWLVEEWVAPLVNKTDGVFTTIGPAPSGVRAKDEVELLEFGILELATPEQRFAALKILVESRKEESVPFVRELIPKTGRPEMQSMLLHVLSLRRNIKDVAVITPFLDSPDPTLRASAAESIGYIRQPTFQIGDGLPPLFAGPPALEASLNTKPPVTIPTAIRIKQDLPGLHDEKIFSSELRSRLEKQMLEGSTQEERLAAACALVVWPPPSYSLRLAEWGVWIENQGQLDLARSVLEEIPPFVHRAGNPLASLTRNRYEGLRTIIITKPIIHLTADRPLAVDLEVVIAGGRPWYAYPRPDDFVVKLDDALATQGNREHQDERLAQFDPKDWPTISPLSEGYPWIHESSRSAGASDAMRWGGSSLTTAVGFRWQSLIVSPQANAWSKVPEVPRAPGYRWWTALRNVPSSWVTSQGETERFLYYDGPSVAKSPLRARLSGTHLTLTTQDVSERLLGKSPEFRSSQPTERDCLFIERPDQQLRAFRFHLTTQPNVEEAKDLVSQTWIEGEGVETTLRQILLERGLTAEEATGLVESWREKFFESPGKRLLTFLTPAEYDRVCPLEIRPKTTERVRVGIVLTEF